MSTAGAAEQVLPNVNYLKARSIASSSRIAIACVNAANSLYYAAQNHLKFLSFRESPQSSVQTTGELSSSDQGIVSVWASNFNPWAEVYVIGARLTTGGAMAFGDAGWGAKNSTAGTEFEGVTIVRDGTMLTPRAVLEYRSYSPYMVAVTQYPRTTPTPVEPRASSAPLIAVYEDDIIGVNTEGTVASAHDILKGAWKACARGLFSENQAFSTTNSSWTNLVDTLSGTSGFQVDCKARQLYTEQTTTNVTAWANGGHSGSGHIEVKFSGSKGSTTLQMSSATNASARASAVFPIDCTADDAVTISYRVVGGGTGYLWSAGVLEYHTSATVE